MEAKNVPRPTDTVRKIRQLYLGAALLWTLLLFLLNIPKRADALVLILIAIPYVIFLTNYCGASKVTPAADKHVSQSLATFLSFGFMIVIILINWNDKEKKQDKSPYFKIIVTALLLLMLSLIEIWVPPKQLPMMKYGRSALQTMAVTLLILSFYLYYTNNSTWTDSS